MSTQKVQISQVELFTEAELESLEFVPEELEAIEQERVPNLESISYKDIAEDLEAISSFLEDTAEALELESGNNGKGTNPFDNIGKGMGNITTVTGGSGERRNPSRAREALRVMGTFVPSALRRRPPSQTQLPQGGRRASSPQASRSGERRASSQTQPPQGGRRASSPQASRPERPRPVSPQTVQNRTAMQAASAAARQGGQGARPSSAAGPSSAAVTAARAAARASSSSSSSSNAALPARRVPQPGWQNRASQLPPPKQTKAPPVPGKK